MIKKTFLLLCLLPLCLILHLQGQEAAKLTLDQCIEIALRQNPLLLSSHQQYQAALARISQAKAFAQPSINWDSDLQPKLFKFRDTGEWYFGLSQEIEFPGKQYLRGKIAIHESIEIQQEVDLLKLDIAFQVKQSFYNLLLARENLKYAELNLELSQDFLKKAELKFDAGDVAKVEVAEAQANINSLYREAEHWKNTIALEVEEAFMNALATRNQIKLFEDEILTQAEEVYNMFLFSYQEGEIGGIELIEARTSYADALFNYRAAIAALEKSIGQPLEGENQ